MSAFPGKRHHHRNDPGRLRVKLRKTQCEQMSSGLRLKADIVRYSRHVSKVPKADLNCRDCDVRSLAGPEPDRQVFAKFKHLLRKAAARSAEITCVTIGEILRAFTPNAPPISETQAIPNPKSIML